MGAETVVTLIGVAVIVGALAVYLIIIAFSLYKVSFTLGTVLIGVRAIAARCEPLGEVLGSIATDVTAIEQALGGLVARAGEGAGEEEDEYQEEEEEPEEEEVYEEVEVVEVERPRLRRARVRR